LYPYPSIDFDLEEEKINEINAPGNDGKAHQGYVYMKSYYDVKLNY
jgi:hypothetical protein